MEVKSNDQFIDRSRVRILLCDNDADTCVHLLSNCSYQVTAVKSPRQVIDALNAEGPDIDIILSEVDLPMKKGLKLLKYIMRDKELQRIPVIMMSTQDEVSLVVKCLRLGAADFLVKPLRSNELLNLWTHMWRRRRLLGLAEKNIITYDFDPVPSDHSDANTNSTILFSDDTDDKSRKTVNPEMSISVQQEDVHPLLQTNKSAMPSMSFFGCRPNLPGISDRKTGQYICFPKRSELKIGESSAFFTYVKSNTAKNSFQSTAAVDAKSKSKKNCPAIIVVDIEADTGVPSSVENKSETRYEHAQNGNLRHVNRDTPENNSHTADFPTSASVPNSASMEFLPYRSNDERSSQVPINGAPIDVSRLGGHVPYSYYMSGMMNHVMPHYNHLPHCMPHAPGMAPFAYYPMNMGMQQGQLPSLGDSPSNEANASKVDRREAALMKFRQKRKERCFDKKIRYVNRKKLAERRPRVRGQFVRKVNGVAFDLNGDPSPADLDEEDEDEDDPTSRNSSPEDYAP